MRDPSPLATRTMRFAGSLVAVILLVAACGSTGTPLPSGSAVASAAPTAQPSASQPGAGVTITVGLISSPTNDAIQKLIPEFTAKTGIKVNVISQDWASGHQKYLLAFKAKQGLYDVVQFDDPYLPAFAGGKFLKPLDDLIKNSTAYDAADIPQNILDYGKIGGVSYALDLSSEPYLLWYRTDLFQKANLTPPTTWDQYVADAKAITDAKLGFGQVAGLAQPGSVPYHWLEILWSYGGDLTDASFNPTVTSQAAIQATQVLKDTLMYSPSSAITASDDDAVSIFCQQPIAMMISFSGYWPVVHDQSKCKPWNTFATTAVPAGPATQVSLLEGWHIGIPSDSTHSAEAWTFMEWMLGKANAGKFLDAGAAAIARTSVAADASLTSKYPYLTTLLSTAMIARPAPRLTEMPELTQAIANRLQDIFTNKMSVTDGLKALQNDLRTVFVNSGRL